MWGEMSEVRREMRGVRFIIIESRVESRSVSTHEGGWVFSNISERRVEGRGMRTHEGGVI